ncbi:MAG: tetratricopeptide repeat protein, partial [Nitrosomonas sp.]|nr:tetratricopeptide repeat protein [Nitrosomonas sp.]
MLNIRTNFRKKTISLLTLIVVIALSTTACGKTKDTETLISEAKQYQKSGDNNAAIIQLKNALQQEPNNPEARFLIGVSYNDIGDVLSAEKELNRALDLGIDNEQVMPILGETLLKIGEFQQLLDKTKDFPDINNSTNMLILRGNAQLALGMNEEAKELFERALTIDADLPEALIGLSRYSLTKNDIDTAMRFAVQASRKNPTNTDAWLFLGDLLRAQGKIDQALEAYNRVVKLDAKNTTALINLATIQITARDFEAAKSNLESV